MAFFFYLSSFTCRDVIAPILFFYDEQNVYMKKIALIIPIF